MLKIYLCMKSVYLLIWPLVLATFACLNTKAPRRRSLSHSEVDFNRVFNWHFMLTFYFMRELSNITLRIFLELFLFLSLSPIVTQYCVNSSEIYMVSLTTPSPLLIGFRYLWMLPDSIFLREFGNFLRKSQFKNMSTFSFFITSKHH